MNLKNMGWMDGLADRADEGWMGRWMNKKPS